MIDVTDKPIQTIMAKIAEQKKAIDELQKKYREDLQENLKSVVADFFDATPEIETVHWTQYAPHFNDGEECVFEVHDKYFSWRGTDHDDIENEDIEYTDSKMRPIEQIREDLRIASESVGVQFKEDDSFFRDHKYDYFTYKQERKPNSSWYAYDTVWDRTLYTDKARIAVEDFEEELARAEEFVKNGYDVERAKKNFEEFRKFLDSIDDDTMRSLFDTDVMVVMSRDGIEEREYDHD